MGIKQSKFIVWGPTSMNIYESETKDKKIMFIGDKHDIPDEQPVISLTDMLGEIKDDREIAYISEGLKECAGAYNCLSLAREYSEEQNKFTFILSDFRTYTDVGKLLQSSTTLYFSLHSFNYKWNESIDTGNDQLTTSLKETMKGYLSSFYTTYKIVLQDPDNVVKNTIDQFKDFRTLLTKLSSQDRKYISKYIKSSIYNGDKDGFITRLKNTRNDLLETKKFIDILVVLKLPVKDIGMFKKFRFVVRGVYEIMMNISSTIFEAYIATFVLVYDFNRYIIHTGAIHTRRLEQLFKSMGYKEYYMSKKVGNLKQAVDISGLTFR